VGVGTIVIVCAIRPLSYSAAAVSQISGRELHTAGMKRTVLIVIGTLVAAAAISAGSIAAYEYFRRDHGYFGGETFAAERQDGSAIRRTQSMSEGVRSGSVLPLAEALDIAAAHVPGEVLKIELEEKHGRSRYEIKVLADNGRVREIKLDAHSGEVLEIEDD
jgi:uncharacterized membrane protein YkoI